MSSVLLVLDRGGCSSERVNPVGLPMSVPTDGTASPEDKHMHIMSWQYDMTKEHMEFGATRPRPVLHGEIFMLSVVAVWLWASIANIVEA